MTIDWKKQWELHAPTYHEGYAHLEQGLRLKPGPGFGDLSHPTTRLMIELIPTTIEEPVVDLGCGSGILSLITAKRGAPAVYGLDIDKSSLKHAKENAALNLLPIFFGKKLPTPLSSCLLLMNMISSEQQIAWQAHPELHLAAKTCIISGIPEEEKGAFLKKAPYGSCVKQQIQDGWVGFVFKV